MKRVKQVPILKIDEDKRQVFGWASIAVRVDGEVVEDYQNDIIETEELEQAAYAYVAEFGVAGEMHRTPEVGRLIESVVFTNNRHYNASDVGEAPANRLGSFRNSWGTKIHISRTGNTLDANAGIESSLMVGGRYVLGEILENGTRRMAPRPYKQQILTWINKEK